MNALQKSRVIWKNVPTQTITAGGVAFAYRELGTDNPGTPVVFLIHLAAVLDNWDPRVVDGFATKHRVITFDNRGVGASSGVPAASMEDMAQDAITFIKAMGLAQVDLFGFSMGGMIAQEIVLMEPQLVRKMIVTGTGPAGGEGISQVARVTYLDMIRGWFTFQDPKQFLSAGPFHGPGPQAVPVLHPDARRNPCGQSVSAALERALRKPRQGHHCGRAAGPIESAAPMGHEEARGSVKGSPSRPRRERRQ